MRLQPPPRVGLQPSPRVGLQVLLLHGDEAAAFALLCALCGELLPGYHTPRMPGLHAGQAVLVEALRRRLPACHARLAHAEVPVREHSTRWLLCLYIDVLPLASAMRLWDLLFAEGAAVLLRAPVAVLAVQEAAQAAAHGTAHGTTPLVADDSSERSESGEVHAAFAAAFRVSGASLARATLEPELVRTVALLMAQSADVPSVSPLKTERSSRVDVPVARRAKRPAAGQETEVDSALDG